MFWKFGIFTKNSLSYAFNRREIVVCKTIFKLSVKYLAIDWMCGLKMKTTIYAYIYPEKKKHGILHTLKHDAYPLAK